MLSVHSQCTGWRPSWLYQFFYSWFCQVDDDMYINTGELEQFLLSRDPNEAHYIGRKAFDLDTVRQIALDHYANKIVSLLDLTQLCLDIYAKKCHCIY